MDSITLVTAFAGLIFGVVGATLGVFNTWREWSRDKVRVKIIPQIIHGDNYDGNFSIEVINLSSFPITIKEIGFLARKAGTRLPFLNFEIINYELPHRLEPRGSINPILLLRANDQKTVRRLRCAYADTSCGLRFTGTSGALKQSVQMARQARK